MKQPGEVAARQRGQLSVLTHEEQREILRRRAERLDACFAPESWELQQAGRPSVQSLLAA